MKLKISIKKYTPKFRFKICNNCQYKIKREVMWKIRIKKDKLSYTELVCSVCAGETKEEVLNNIYNGNLSSLLDRANDFIDNYNGNLKRYKNDISIKERLEKNLDTINKQ